MPQNDQLTGSMRCTGKSEYCNAFLLMIPGVSQSACLTLGKHGTRTDCNVVPGRGDPVTGRSDRSSRRLSHFFPFKRIPDSAIIEANFWTNDDFPTFAQPTTKTSLPARMLRSLSAKETTPYPVFADTPCAEINLHPEIC